MGRRQGQGAARLPRRQRHPHRVGTGQPSCARGSAVSPARTHAVPQKAARGPFRSAATRTSASGQGAEVVGRHGQRSPVVILVGLADRRGARAARRHDEDQADEDKKKEADDKKTKDALKAAGEAALKTPQGQAVKEKVLADPVVKTVVDAVTSTPGLIVSGAALAVRDALARRAEAADQPPRDPLEKLSSELAGVTARSPGKGRRRSDQRRPR